MKKKITFKELAILSGVSIGTLSRYFNNGSISEDKKKIIKDNIEKYGFIKNASAARVKKPTGTIILRTFFRSTTQDNIVSGIISVIGIENVIVKYSGVSEKEVLKAIDWAVEQRPENLVIFAPINPTDKIIEKIKNVKQYAKIVTYDLYNEEVSNVSISYELAFRNLAKKHKGINFIYDNEDDKHSYQNRLKVLRKYFNKIETSKNIINNHNINLFQTENLRKIILENCLKKGEVFKNISVGYDKPMFFESDDEWIFVDSFLVGVTAAKLLKERNTISSVVNGKLVEN